MATPLWRWTAGQLLEVEVGVQPEQHGRLLCRYCGNWYRSLGHHLVGRKHGVALAVYRAEFELPETMALMAADLREQQARRGRELLSSNSAVRDAFAVDQPIYRERLQRGRARKAQTNFRAGVQRSKKATGVLLADSSRQRADQRRHELDEIARSYQYKDLPDLLRATTALTHAQLGGLLGCRPDSARQWRSKLGVRSDAKRAAQVDRRARRGEAAGERAHTVPADTPPRPRAQPQDNGRLVCLECATPWRDLGKHVEQAHRMDQAVYRQRHGLAAACSLRCAELDQKVRAGMAAVGRASGELRRARFVQRYDDLAKAAGFRDVRDLLADRGNPEVAKLLGLASANGAARIRRRYHATASVPS